MAALRAHLVGEISFTRELIARLDGQLTARIHAARECGITWQQIADALGVSNQAAQQRYGRRPPDHD